MSIYYGFQVLHQLDGYLLLLTNFELKIKDGEYACSFNKTAEPGTYEVSFQSLALIMMESLLFGKLLEQSMLVKGRIVIEANRGRPSEPDLCFEKLVKLIEKSLKK